MRGRKRDPDEVELETDASSSLLDGMLSIVRVGKRGPTDASEESENGHSQKQS